MQGLNGPQGNKGQPGIPGDKVQYVYTKHRPSLHAYFKLVMVINWARFASWVLLFTNTYIVMYKRSRIGVVFVMTGQNLWICESILPQSWSVHSSTVLVFLYLLYKLCYCINACIRNPFPRQAANRCWPCFPSPLRMCQGPVGAKGQKGEPGEDGAKVHCIVAHWMAFTKGLPLLPLVHDMPQECPCMLHTLADCYFSCIFLYTRWILHEYCCILHDIFVYLLDILVYPGLAGCCSWERCSRWSRWPWQTGKADNMMHLPCVLPLEKLVGHLVHVIVGNNYEVV